MSLDTFGEKLELRSEVEIAAEPSIVWAVFVDLPTHQRWNPFWSNLEGRVDVGAKIKLELTVPGGKSLQVSRRVEVFDPERELVWSGKYGWGWILRSEQYVRLNGTDGGRTRLVVGENLRGPGVTGNGQLTMNIARGQALMNQALKQHVEGKRRP